MTNEYKTLRELDVQPGDVVQNNTGRREIIAYITGDGCLMEGGHTWLWNNPIWRIVSRASDTPKLWRDMTPEEKGALLLAEHEGEIIEVLERNGWMVVSSIGDLDYAYRVRPEPKRETVTYTWGGDVLAFSSLNMEGTHLITFDLIDGKPDCGSIKMEEL